jgi:DNA repair exonuclease SbcCD ATPase subunit
MRIRKRKELTYRIRALVVLASMMFLAEGARCDQVEIIVANHYKKLMKEQETVYAEEKKTLEQELNQEKEEKRLAELNLKSVIGGAGDTTPVVEKVKELVEIVKEDAATLEEALVSLNENLNDVPGFNLVGKVETLKGTLAVTQEEKVALEQKHREAKGIIKTIKKTTGGSGTGTPILTRLDGLRNSSDTIKVLEQKLVAVPGDKLLEKLESLITERDLAKERLEKMEQAILAKEETIIDLKESLEDMEETIIAKEGAINDLHVQLLGVESERDSLDAQLSQEQVAHLEKRAQLDHVLVKQFNCIPTNSITLTRTPERPS